MGSLFPGSAAPLAADGVLVTEFVMGLALTAGAMLARRRRFRAHACCQGAVVLLNLVLVAAYMVPSFRRAVALGLPTHLGRSYYWLATAHGLMGTAAELLALYVLLVAGTQVLPRRLRFGRYKLWMRTTLVLWWCVLVLGLAMYIRWYVVRPAHHPPHRRALLSASAFGLANCRWFHLSGSERTP
jgi:uncharacterized membrane protein YozB (DUF420 family)